MKIDTLRSTSCIVSASKLFQSLWRIETNSRMHKTIRRSRQLPKKSTSFLLWIGLFLGALSLRVFTNPFLGKSAGSCLPFFFQLTLAWKHISSDFVSPSWMGTFTDSTIILNLLAGGVSGGIARFFVAPLDVVKIRFQVRVVSFSHAYYTRCKSTLKLWLV